MRPGRHITGWKELRAERRAAVPDPDLALAMKEAELARPKTRGQCGTDRPCPWVSCRFHVKYDVAPSGGLQENHPGAEIEDLPETCALDVADRGGATLEEVGEVLGVCRERIRQVELEALRKLRRRFPRKAGGS